MTRYLLPLMLCVATLWSEATPTDMSPYGVDVRHYMKIRILDQRSLSYPDIDGHHFSEISDVAYDNEKQKLYLLSDQGIFFGFSAQFGETIDKLNLLHAKKLVARKGKPFKRWELDSEGMTLGSKKEFLVSFEGRAKVGSFDKDGTMQKQYPIPSKLRDPKNYRSRNKSLEALAWHPKYGAITATEWPLKEDRAKEQTIYALSGGEWHFRAEEATGSAVVGMEVMDDGNLLVLERAYSGLTNPVVITLKKVWLERCKKKSKMCHTEILARFSSADGWHIDNFEGLAKVGKNRYIIVSDDNDNFYQRTLLVYFEVIEKSR